MLTAMTSLDDFVANIEKARSECHHPNFNVMAKVNVIPDVGIVNVDLRVSCRDCGAPFEFAGLTHGYSPYQPTVSLDNQELNVPIVPVGGKVPSGLPGYTIMPTQVGEQEEPTKQ